MAGRSLTDVSRSCSSPLQRGDDARGEGAGPWPSYRVVDCDSAIADRLHVTVGGGSGFIGMVSKVKWNG